MASKNPSFRLTSLTVREDLVQPPVLPACLQADDSADALAAQEQAAASRFHEVKIKLANDCKAMASYNSEKNKVASKLHVLKVLHEKAQLAAGKQRLRCKMFFLYVAGWIKNQTNHTINYSSAVAPHVQILLRVVDDFMKGHCFMSLTPELPSEVDQMIRAAAVRAKAFFFTSKYIIIILTRKPYHPKS